MLLLGILLEAVLVKLFLVQLFVVIFQQMGIIIHADFATPLYVLGRYGTVKILQM
jgi:hypothetical protein